jgi:putative membrane protein
MHNLKQLSVALFATMALGAAAQLHANEAPADGQVSPRNFVEEASAKGVAEIETAKLALEKGTTDDVKEFAQTMVEDHTAANKELTALAQQKELEVSTEAELINKAKAMILQLRGEKSFDKAYMNNQVMAHQQTIELFQKASNAEDAEIAAFAKQTLPKLEHHLKMAEQINAQLPEQ